MHVVCVNCGSHSDVCVCLHPLITRCAYVVSFYAWQRAFQLARVLLVLARVSRSLLAAENQRLLQPLSAPCRIVPC